MMMHWWETELRQQWEFPILREYHALIRYGVSGYEWEQLLNDYKLAAVQSIYVAFFDLRCSDLWTK